ncbi:MAG: hypothetical protein IT300_14895 [Dehalococcoidia bacterium]|nr:hypothetical protein [Dehalococcoidia bacterium]
MTEGMIPNPDLDPMAAAESTRGAMGRRVFTQAAIGVAAAGLAAGLTGWSAVRHRDEGEREPSEFSRNIVARRTPDPLPRDPGATAWKSAEPLDISLEPQRMIEPRLTREPGITNVQLRTMHNGKEIGFHVSWEDPNRSDLEVAAQFRDSVAIQLPVKPEGPSFTVMGQPGRPVHLLHWRASWQRAMDKATLATNTIRDTFPNAVSDVSPEDVMKPELAQKYYPAQVAGNPMAERKRASAVEELVAEGFGTITSQQEQRAEGLGVYSGGRWEVVLIVPMAGKEDQNQASLHPGDHTSVAVAVWNGGKGDRGARKQFAYWTGLEVGT